MNKGKYGKVARLVSRPAYCPGTVPSDFHLTSHARKREMPLSEMNPTKPTLTIFTYELAAYVLLFFRHFSVALHL